MWKPCQIHLLIKDIKIKDLADAENLVGGFALPTGKFLRGKVCQSESFDFLAFWISEPANLSQGEMMDDLVRS